MIYALTIKMIIDLFKPKKKISSLINYFSNDYIDIHSHILPGIDDGAKTMGHSIELLTNMYKLGISNFVFTPHVIEGIWENSTEKILSTFHELKSVVDQTANLKDINIRVSAEYMMDENFQKLLENKDFLPIKDNKILVEMSYLAPPANLFETIAEIQVKGFIPILAHPERYKSFHQDLAVYQKLKSAGCLFQMNMISLSNYYGKDVHESAIWLLRNNMIDFIGSDLHHMKHMEVIESVVTRKNMMELVMPIIYNNHQLK